MKHRLRRLVRSTTTHLATTYLLIIMVMSLGFSVVFYKASAHELNRQIPPRNAQFNDNQGNLQPPNRELHDFLQQRAHEGRSELMVRLIIVNSAALVVGGGVSYGLARRTLRPIEQAMEAQSRFVSDASHELRTPLTAIQASNDVALRNPKLTLGVAKQIIRDNTAETLKLKQLSDSLLDLAQHGMQSAALTPVAVQDVVSEAMNQLIPLAQEKDIQIDDATPNRRVLSNGQALRQVLVIVLDNAIKYSHVGGSIELSGEQKGNYLYLTITDHGVGMRASDLPHIFRRFYRADSARSDGHRHGYGLGLAIAQGLLERHDASITATSQPGKGSAFTIKLRLVR